MKSNTKCFVMVGCLTKCGSFRFLLSLDCCGYNDSEYSIHSKNILHFLLKYNECRGCSSKTVPNYHDESRAPY